jgi:hypothetical protein
MLSTIIYETADFVYTISRIAVNSVTKLYKWYYPPKQLNQLNIIEKKIIELEEQRANIKLKIGNVDY